MHEAYKRRTSQVMIKSRSPINYLYIGIVLEGFDVILETLCFHFPIRTSWLN